jgi:ATP-dependent helicase/nuclease subunit A
MDLAFELDGTVYVIDYKTDRDEIPDRHREQLAVYRKAAKDLFGKPVETWLFYLRTGHAVPVRDDNGDLQGAGRQ